MQERTHDGKAFRIFNVIDEYTREYLAARVGWSFTHQDVITTQFICGWVGCLTELFCERGVPVHIRSDNRTEFITARLRGWLNRLAVKPLFIEPDSSWKNGHVETFNGKLRDELLNREIFY